MIKQHQQVTPLWFQCFSTFSLGTLLHILVRCFCACLLAAHSSSYCSCIQEYLQRALPQLHLDDANQLSHGLCALQPNISYPGPYPVMECGLPLYANTRAFKWSGQLGSGFLATFSINFVMCDWILMCRISVRLVLCGGRFLLEFYKYKTIYPPGLWQLSLPVGSVLQPLC